MLSLLPPMSIRCSHRIFLPSVGKRTFLKSNFDQSFKLRLERTSLETQTLQLVIIKIKIINVGDIQSNLPL